MEPSTVVIGANFGDEGKGLITDFEVRRLSAATVCRFNGGAQAGHTVIDGDKRHVFGHFGAGTFAGASTYLSSNFIVNPMLLVKEHAALQKLGLTPELIIHKDAPVSTLYDVALNALAEINRGSAAHGSCGVGINETVRRSQQLKISFADLAGDSVIDSYARLYEDIRQKYLPKRIEELFDDLSELSANEEAAPHLSILQADALHLANVTRNLLMREGIKFREEVSAGPIVFEGAQGLQLDQDLGLFPNVTRSLTGLPQAVKAAADLHVKELKPVYVTRSYLTRHGNGPLFKEGTLPFSFDDQTNKPNRWQGTLRSAPLDIPALKYFISKDMNRSRWMADMFGVKICEPTIAITWMDVAKHVPIVMRTGVVTRVQNIQIDDLPKILEEELGFKISHLAYGPKSTDVLIPNY